VKFRYDLVVAAAADGLRRRRLGESDPDESVLRAEDTVASMDSATGTRRLCQQPSLARSTRMFPATDRSMA
jgi:hypothetical protein